MRRASLVLIASLMAAPLRTNAAPGRWSEDYFNPQPIPAAKPRPADANMAPDLILPMPCGGAMAFRPVVVPADGMFEDRLMTVGSLDGDQAYKESQRTDHIAGSLSDPKDPKQRLYYIGKYEVTALQYAAVSAGATAGACPTAGAEAALPKTRVTWFDAVGFGDAYTKWLIANAPDKLPREAGQPAFVRLPTEDEWDFAARGGVKVSEAEFAAPLPPDWSSALSKYVWFSGTQSSNGELQGIGMLLPNALGIHDMLGNASEIVLDLFRLTRLSRPHGEGGGFVLRGGSYRTEQADIRTSWREELQPYTSNGESRAGDVGFRVVVVGPIFPTAERVRAAREQSKQWHDAGAPVLDTNEHDSLKEIAALQKAVTEPALKKGLDQLLNDETAQRLESQDEKNLAVRGKLNLAVWLFSDMILEVRGKLLFEEQQKARNPDAAADAMDQKISARIKSEFENYSSYYRDTVEALARGYTMEGLRAQAEVLRQELGQRHPDQVVWIAEVLSDCGAYQKKGDISPAEIENNIKKKFCRSADAAQYRPCEGYR